MIPELATAIDQGRPVVLATVVRTSRSVPRRPGSKMLVFDDQTTLGTVGGGAMEHRVTLEAAEVLAEGSPRLVSYRLLDPTDGDPGICGGDVDIYLEPYLPTPVVHLHGRGPTVQAIADLAARLDFRVDHDPAEAPGAVTGAGPRDAIVVATEDPGVADRVTHALAHPTTHVTVIDPAADPRPPRRLALVVMADIVAHRRRPVAATH